MKAILKVVFVIIGTMIGAGFASGQEIWLFFNKYGNWGIAGIVLACSLSGILVYQVFRIFQKEDINTYTELLENVSHKKVLKQAISIIISLFLLVTFYVMIACMSAYFNQEFGLPIWICSIIMAFLCYITLQRDMNGIVIVNTVLIPFLILFILYLGFQNLDFTIEYFNTQHLEVNSSLGWIISSVLYASYNSIILIPILVELKQYITLKSKAKKASILCTTILALLGVCLFCLLLRNQTAYQLELPMLAIVKDFGGIYPHLYGAVVIVAIFTSAISAGYGFLKNEVAKRKFIKGDIGKREQRYYQRLLLVICIIAPVVANFGFSTLVSKLYPMFGILGLLQMVLLFKLSCND